MIKKVDLNKRFLDNVKWSDQQKEDFKNLYIAYFKYVYKYEVGYEDHFDVTNMLYQLDMENFAQELDDAGMTIKVVLGY